MWSAAQRPFLGVKRTWRGHVSMSAMTHSRLWLVRGFRHLRRELPAPVGSARLRGFFMESRLGASPVVAEHAIEAGWILKPQRKALKPQWNPRGGTKLPIHRLAEIRPFPPRLSSRVIRAQSVTSTFISWSLFRFAIAIAGSGDLTGAFSLPSFLSSPFGRMQRKPSRDVSVPRQDGLATSRRAHGQD